MKHGLSIGGMLVQLLPESPSGTIWLITMLVIVGAVRGEERCLGNTSSPTPTSALQTLRNPYRLSGNFLFLLAFNC